MSCDSRLNSAFQNAPCIPLTANSKFVLISDCHRGNGTSNDNFLKNQNLYFAALRHYYEKGFTYVELGDGDELWENRSLKQIIEIHSNVFWLLTKFYQEKRLFMIYGNHDIVKRSSSYDIKHCQTFKCSGQLCDVPLFPGMKFYEGIILKDENKKQDIYLTHGHQGDFLNSSLWRFSRFLVRYVWKPLEHFGFLDPTSAAKNNTKKKKTEKNLSDWAFKEQHLLITGHTHRPMMGMAGSPYFNTGSCVHPRCITCIEIVSRCMTLVKWTIHTWEDMTLYVAREELAGPVCIDNIPSKLLDIQSGHQ